MSRTPPFRPAVRAAVLVAALASGSAAFAAPPARLQDLQAAPGTLSLHDALEQEKAVTNLYKAFFPDRETARKAAISFHAQLLESQLAAGYLVLELDAQELDALRAFGFRFEPATNFIERRNRRLTQFQIAAARRAAGEPEPRSIPGYSCYETVEETFAAGDGLVAARPTLATWVDAGDSWLKANGAGGYDLRVLKLTNSAVAGDKPKLFVNAAIHAREYTTAPLVLAFARWLVDGHGSVADATWILDHHEVHLMFHANPDGRKRAETGLSWRKNVDNNHCANTNTRGVDLNRNFSFEWNSTGGQGSSSSACSLTYRGPTPASEPETQAVEAYVRSLWPDRRGPGVNDAAPPDTSGIHIDIHSYSELVLWPWGATAAPAPNGAALQTLGRRFAFFNGYQPTQSIGLYPTDGTSDGPSYGELGVAAYTFELGTSFFQSCSVFENTVKPGNLPALIYAAKVVRTPYLTPAGPEVLAPTLAGGAASVVAGTTVRLGATATDTRFNNSNGSESTQAIVAAEFTVGLPPWDAAAAPRPLVAADGSFNTPTEVLAGTLSTFGLSTGRHTVYLRARDASGSWGPVSALFLDIGGQPLTVAEVESNDTLASAQAVATLPAVVQGGFEGATRTARRADADVYRVSLAAGATLSATLTPGASTSAGLELLAADGQRLAYSAPGTGVASVAGHVNTTASALTLYVRAAYVGGAFGSFPGRYTLTLAR
ncbi:MAG: M14 family zinc carboxypeptidase [Rubrivivax sp.]|nr:M14 family zinc carboxypeptidase [Rubrivivax sp.]